MGSRQVEGSCAWEVGGRKSELKLSSNLGMKEKEIGAFKETESNDKSIDFLGK